LKDLLHEENQKMVSLEADGKLPFDPIVTVIDFCRSLGVEVAVSLSGM
jgi:biopolymer transport protein ExbD